MKARMRPPSGKERANENENKKIDVQAIKCGAKQSLHFMIKIL